MTTNEEPGEITLAESMARIVEWANGIDLGAQLEGTLTLTDRDIAHLIINQRELAGGVLAVCEMLDKVLDRVVPILERDNH